VRLQRRMHEIAGEYRVVLAAAHREGDVTGRVARRRQDADVVADRMVVADELMASRLHDRQHAIGERGDLRLRILCGPVIEFLLREDVARLREGRDPATVLQPRVPADVIDMQMRAHHEVDVIDREPRGVESTQIRVVGLHVPFRPIGARLVVADAAVDQNGMVRRLHHVGLEAQQQDVLVIQRLRFAHPCPVLGQHFARQPRQHLKRRDERGFLLDDTMDGEIADRVCEAHENSCDYAGGGTEIFTEGRSSIFWWKASSLG